LNLNSKRESPCSKGTCTSIPGVGFVCACQPGYSGRFCNVQIDFCSSNPCLNNGVCIIGTNNYSCSCNLQYTGKNCEILINYCNSNPCLNGATCSIATNFAGYTCSCPSQYTGSTYFSEKTIFHLVNLSYLLKGPTVIVFKIHAFQVHANMEHAVK